MYSETTRDMNEQERAALRKELDASCPVTARGTVKWLLLWLSGIVLVAVIAGSLIALKPGSVVGGIAGGALICGAVICLYALITLTAGFVRWRRAFREFERITVPQIREALRDGRVHSKRVQTSAVIKIAEFEDEGAGYIFDIGDGRSLLLKGQQYFPAQDGMPWPASSFELVRGPDRRLWIGLFSAGTPLSPAQIIPMEDCVEDCVWSEKEEVVNASPAEVLRAILKTPSRVSARPL